MRQNFNYPRVDYAAWKWRPCLQRVTLLLRPSRQLCCVRPCVKCSKRCKDAMTPNLAPLPAPEQRAVWTAMAACFAMIAYHAGS